MVMLAMGEFTAINDCMVCSDVSRLNIGSPPGVLVAAGSSGAVRNRLKIKKFMPIARRGLADATTARSRAEGPFRV
jgi:hypothetical protein